MRRAQKGKPKGEAPLAITAHERLRRDAGEMLAVLTKHLGGIPKVIARAKLAAKKRDPYFRTNMIEGRVSVQREECWRGGYRVEYRPPSESGATITLYVRAPSSCRLIAAAGSALEGYQPFHREKDLGLLQLRVFPDFGAVLAELERLRVSRRRPQARRASTALASRGTTPRVEGKYAATHSNTSYSLTLDGDAGGGSFTYSNYIIGALGRESTDYEGRWSSPRPGFLELRARKVESDSEVGFHDRDVSSRKTDYVMKAAVLDGGWAIAIDGRLLFPERGETTSGMPSDYDYKVADDWHRNMIQGVEKNILRLKKALKDLGVTPPALPKRATTPQGAGLSVRGAHKAWQERRLREVSEHYGVLTDLLGRAKRARPRRPTKGGRS